MAQKEIEVLDIDWAVHVLARIRGLGFPASKEQIAERLRGMVVKGRAVEEILDEIEYPVKSPAELLHKIRERL